MSAGLFTERLNQTTEMPTATTVRIACVSDFVTTKVPTDWVNWSHTDTEALTRHVTAHRSEIPRKQRRTCACAITCEGIGQKSAAIRWASGRPIATDRTNATATSAVPSVGCRK